MIWLYLLLFLAVNAAYWVWSVERMKPKIRSWRNGKIARKR